MTTAYPLAWPAAVPRTKARGQARFRTRRGDGGNLERLTVAEAVARLFDQLDLMRATHAVISSNVELRQDGKPRSGQPEPSDPGVAVYFQLRGRPYCLPCDRWDRVADNIAAVAGHIDATRAIERYGVASVEKQFEGFAQLPTPPNCWAILGIAPTRNSDEISAAYRAKARTAHPDAGGSNAAMQELTAARDAAMKEIGS